MFEPRSRSSLKPRTTKSGKAHRLTFGGDRISSKVNHHKKAMAYCENILPFLSSIRYHCDKLELTVDDEIWPMAKYRELLFIR